MSYARWGVDGSDVYVYGANDGERDYWVCMDCFLNDPDRRNSTYTTAAGMLTHLEAHRAVGHVVPDRAFDRLRKEIAE